MELTIAHSRARGAGIRTFHARGRLHRHRAVLGCRVPGPVGALGVVDRHGGEGGTIGFGTVLRARRATKIAPALAHQHALQIHLQRVFHIQETHQLV